MQLEYQHVVNRTVHFDIITDGNFLLLENFKSSDFDDAICSSDGISEDEFSILTGKVYELCRVRFKENATCAWTNIEIGISQSFVF